MQCPEAALLWPDLATEWPPETEAPVTVVTRNILLLVFTVKITCDKNTFSYIREAR
jgi:hypothetical protein